MSSEDFDREVEQCDHEPLNELDPENYDLGDEVTCHDCGLGFVVQTDDYQLQRYFLAETARGDSDD